MAKAREKAPPPLAALKGRWGLWQLEASCGQCGMGARCGRPVAEQSEALVVKAIAARSICDGVFLGKPRNRCGWPLSFGWLFVPPEGR